MRSREISSDRMRGGGWQQSLHVEWEAWNAALTNISLRMRRVATILRALALRELMTRFGRDNLGFVWLVFEPLLLTVLVLIWWSMAFGSTKQGVAIVPLALSGYSLLTLWRHINLRFIYCFRHNAPLMFHRSVKPMYTILARFFLETTGALLSFFTAYTFLFAFYQIGPIHDVFLFLSGWYLLAFFSFSVALCVSALCELWEPTEKLYNPLMYITLPLTGLFFMVSWLPTDYHALALLSPSVNCFEMARGGLIGPYVQVYYHVDYVIYVSVFLSAFGFLLMRKAQAHIKIE